MKTEQLEQIEELALRAVACKRWRWMPGMLGVHDAYKHDRLYGRILEIDATEGPMWVGCGDVFLPLEEGTYPDLRDPATLGCLLALVREAHRDPKIHMVWLIGGIDTWEPWNTERPLLAPLLKFYTEAEALVSALEVAP
jgi:hypothetical protein